AAGPSPARPAPAGLGWALLLVLLGCAAFGALGILLGGTLRAEITLAVANVVWFVLLLAGGIVVPLDQLPGPLATVAALLPSGALAEGLRLTLSTGQPPGGLQVLVLLAWAAAATAVALRAVKLR
ncbi:MAG TPA: ABC transporter permease, partial [Pseudonocardia sp.]|nr:ABC transporter permease [Pseudonocardia sp.]